jgi:hypothetical protein
MKRLLWIAIGAALLLLIVGNAVAASGFSLTWWTAGGGGGASSASGFNLSSTIGQADAGGGLAGGDYRLAGGIWATGGQGTQLVYLPLVVR